MIVKTAPKIYSSPPQGKWSYDDYAHLPDDGMRYEIIRGDLYMSPAPRPIHQRIIVALLKYLLTYLEKRPVGEFFISPIDVILPGLANPVQPDLLFITNEHLHIVQEKAIKGVPDLIVEVLSPGSITYDRNIKFQLYASTGVLEYWIIDPDAHTVEVNLLRGTAYAMADSFKCEEHIRSELLVGFSMPVNKIFLQ